MCSYLLLPSRLPLWRRKWQPTPVFLPGKSQGQKNLDSYSPWYHKSQTQFKPSPPENYLKHICSFCCCSAAQSCLTLYDPVDCSTPGFPVLHYPLEPTLTHVRWAGAAIQPSHSLSSPYPPALIFLSIRVFSNESALHIRWPKYWSFSFSISASSKYSGLISFRMDWFDLLAVQGTLKESSPTSKASILHHSAFFMVQLSLPYMTTGKTIASAIWTFVDKVMSLLFNMLYRFVTAFLPRSKWLLLSWLQSPSAVILEPKKIKSVTLSIVSPSICHEVMGLDAMILIF